MPPRKPLILLVDDFEDASDIYSTYLGTTGIPSTVRRAVPKRSSRRGSGVLDDSADIRMPDMTGTEVMRTLRADPEFRNVPIIALTAHALDDERQEALSAGFDAVVAKPCLPDELLAFIENLLTKWKPTPHPTTS